jgi:hypothetical protein
MPKWLDKVEGYADKVFRPRPLKDKKVGEDPTIKKAAGKLKGRKSQIDKELEKYR